MATCGGAAVLRVLREGHGSLHAVLLHLLDGVLRQRLHVAEADVELVRGCREKERRRETERARERDKLWDDFRSACVLTPLTRPFFVFTIGLYFLMLS